MCSLSLVVFSALVKIYVNQKTPVQHPISIVLCVHRHGYNFMESLQKYCKARKFGRELNWAIWWSAFATAKLKFLTRTYIHIRMVIPYQTPKLKSANIFAMDIWDPTAKFNSHQYFRVYCTRKMELLTT